MGFSADWLALREPADHRSRSAELLANLAKRVEGRDVLRITDLGCGTGSNLRATAPALGPNQEWTLVDYDPALLERAAKVLTEWADEAKAIGDNLVLVKDGKNIGITFRIADLNTELEKVISGEVDIVTASALFDLISEPWMRRFVKALKTTPAIFYTVLTYNGDDDFVPAHPFDWGMINAFKIHQKRDKGFGPAEGPLAAGTLARILREEGYGVETADTPWVLKPSDIALKTELLKGLHGAVMETGLIADNGANDWLFWRTSMGDQKGSRMKTGHTDILATKA
ncbi:MAG: class I SAM-dependent methyltransferase [Beijerinckiaceae bacterium]|nr:class I SAM-dependent methyltransferase [Beijerinckiaceae bacterium]